MRGRFGLDLDDGDISQALFENNPEDRAPVTARFADHMET